MINLILWLIFGALVGWLAGLCGASIALLICALLSLMIVGAGWMWRNLLGLDVVLPEEYRS